MNNELEGYGRMKGRKLQSALAEAVRYWVLTAEGKIKSQVNSCEI
jgi:hypothetical protein